MRQTALVVLLLAGLALAGGLVEKGRRFVVDAPFSQGFEEEGWELGWTLVDGDGSGSSWQRLSRDMYYEPHGGEWSLGCRYNSDGSANDDWLISPPLRADSARTELSLRFRSQDVDFLEHIRIYSLESSQVQDFQGLGSGQLESLFQQELDNSRVPASWQEWQKTVPADTSVVWYIAVRCLSADRFVLLVDTFTGLNTVASGSYFVEQRFRPHDIGAIPVDSFRVSPLRVWNLAAAESLWVAPRFLDDSNGFDLAPPFFIDNLTSDTLLVLPEARLDLQTGLQGTWQQQDGPDLRFGGSRATHLLLGWTSDRQGPWNTDTLELTGSVWDPDSLELYFHSQTFSASHLDSLAGWANLPAEGSPGWAVGEFVSSLNFTVPWRGQAGPFVYINSDAQGLWRADGITPAVQNDTLRTPMIALPGTGPLTLGYELYYNDGGGAGLELLARSPGTGWQLIQRPSGAGTGWRIQALGLDEWKQADSLQLAFVYRGHWSYGVAIDNLVLQAGGAALAAPRPGEVRDLPRTVAAELSPNPFNPVTVLSYQAPGAGTLRWRVYTIQGRLVQDSGSQRVHAGENRFTLDLGRSAAGLYLLHLEGRGAGGEWPALTRKLTLVK